MTTTTTDGELRLSVEEAAMLIQSMVLSRSAETGQVSRDLRKSVAKKLEEIFPGIVALNFGENLLR